MKLSWVSLAVVASALRADEAAVEVRAGGLAPTASDAATDEHHQTCKQLGLAYLLSLPIPLPPPGISVVPAVAMGVCCPDVIYQKLVEKGGQAIRALKSLSHSKARRAAERLAAEVIPNEYLTDEQIEHDMLDVKHEEIAALYQSLVKEHGLRNPSGGYQRLEAYVRKSFGKYSKARFDRAHYQANMDTLAIIEQSFPWVLYPRLVQAYNDSRLTPEERAAFVALMERLKASDPWLPAVKDAELPAALQHSEDTKLVEEYARMQDEAMDSGEWYESVVSTETGRDKTWTAMNRLAQTAHLVMEKRAAMCQMIGRLTGRVVTKMQKWMTGRATDFQLQDLRQRVRDLSAEAP